MENVKKAAFFSAVFWHSYWITLRPYLFFVSGVAGLAGLAMVKDIPIISYKWILIFIITFFSYGLGQAITDCSQLDTDSLSSPYRPLVKKIITPSQVITVTLVFLIASALILGIFQIWSLIFVAIMTFGSVLYTFFKRRFYGGPPWLSAVVALIPALAYVAATPDFHAHKIPDSLYWLFGSVFFGYAIFVILGYFKDISADTKTNYQTIVVKFGWNTGVVASLIAALLTLYCSIMTVHRYVTWQLSFESAVAFLLWAAGAFTLHYAHYQMTTICKNEKLAYVSIENSVRGFVLLHGGMVVLLNPKLSIFTIVFLLVFEVTIRFRPERTQV